MQRRSAILHVKSVSKPTPWVSELDGMNFLAQDKSPIHDHR